MLVRIYDLYYRRGISTLIFSNCHDIVGDLLQVALNDRWDFGVVRFLFFMLECRGKVTSDVSLGYFYKAV